MQPFTATSSIHKASNVDSDHAFYDHQHRTKTLELKCASALQHLDGVQSSMHVEQAASHHQGLSEIQDEGEELFADGARDPSDEAIRWRRLHCPAVQYF